MVAAPSSPAYTSAGRRCLVCEGLGPFVEVFARGGYRMVRCPQCRLVFQDPQPPDEVLDASYYHDPEFTATLFGPYREWTLQRARESLRMLVASSTAPAAGRALDVGCSSGAWLEVLATAGWTASGVELGAHTAQAARARGLDVHTGTLADAAPALAGERFDLITFWEVFEHLRDPVHELRIAAELLAPGGRLAATFPNVEGWYPRATHRLLARRTGVWEYPELPLHLYDFGPRTASRLLERCGYRVIELHTFPVPFFVYRSTTLSRAALGAGARGRMLALAFDLLHLAIYPPARLFDRGNEVFVVAERAG
jgi:SAM-dependent methyltransferase